MFPYLKVSPFQEHAHSYFLFQIKLNTISATTFPYTHCKPPLLHSVQQFYSANNHITGRKLSGSFSKFLVLRWSMLAPSVFTFKHMQMFEQPFLFEFWYDITWVQTLHKPCKHFLSILIFDLWTPCFKIPHFKEQMLPIDYKSKHLLLRQSLSLHHCSMEALYLY